jgi:hypothetical protein
MEEEFGDDLRWQSAKRSENGFVPIHQVLQLPALAKQHLNLHSKILDGFVYDPHIYMRLFDYRADVERFCF